jgi:hypothetical protein
MLWGGGGGGTRSPMLAAFLAGVAAVLVAWFVIMGLTGWLAARKNRDGGLWVVIAIFGGPLALLAVLLLPAKPAPADGPAGLAPVPRLRLRSETTLELEVPEGVVLVPGTSTPRVEGRPGFNVSTAADWRWASGEAMPVSERTRLLDAVRSSGRHEGWNLTFDPA